MEETGFTYLRCERGLREWSADESLLLATVADAWLPLLLFVPLLRNRLEGLNVPDVSLPCSELVCACARLGNGIPNASDINALFPLPSAPNTPHTFVKSVEGNTSNSASYALSDGWAKGGGGVEEGEARAKDE